MKKIVQIKMTPQAMLRRRWVRLRLSRSVVGPGEKRMKLDGDDGAYSGRGLAVRFGRVMDGGGRSVGTFGASGKPSTPRSSRLPIEMT
jgi:hypothetical protein